MRRRVATETCAGPPVRRAVIRDILLQVAQVVVALVLAGPTFWIFVVSASFAAMSLAAKLSQAGFVREWYVFQTVFQGFHLAGTGTRSHWCSGGISLRPRCGWSTPWWANCAGCNRDISTFALG
jgi:ABC-type glycerol-3-phosphate transport system permease component